MKPSKIRSCLLNLKKSYTDETHPLYLSGITQIYNHYNGALPIKIIEDFLSTIPTYTIHRQAKRPIPRNPTFVYYKRFQFQCDTIEISRLKKWNNGYTWILGVIDVWSRKAFCRLMFTKSADETVSCMKDILKEAVFLPETVCFDRGSELKNKKMTEFLTSLNIKIYYSDTFGHCSFIERWNFTIQSLIYKHIEKSNSFKFHHKLQTLCDVYNKRKHSFLKMSPNEAELPKNKIKVALLHENKYLKYKHKSPKYSVGTIVRVSKQKNKMSRGYGSQFQKERFYIHKVLDHLPRPLYVLKSVSKPEDPIEGKFYESEIFKSTKY